MDITTGLVKILVNIAINKKSAFPKAQRGKHIAETSRRETRRSQLVHF